MATYAALLEEARKLPDEARWALGRALLEDLDDTDDTLADFDPDIADAWREEIRRRTQAYDNGQPGVPLREAWMRIFNEDGP